MLPKGVFLLAIDLLPLVSAGQKGLESRNDACQSGIYGELRQYLIGYQPAQLFCSSVYPPDCSTKSEVKRQPSTRSIASITSATPFPTAKASPTVSSSASSNGNPKNNSQGSAWSKLRGLAGDIVKTLCSCIEQHTTCPTTSSTISSTSSSITSTSSTPSSSTSSSPTSGTTSTSTSSSSAAASTSCSVTQAGGCGTTCSCLVDLSYQPLCGFGTLCLQCKSDADCQAYPGGGYTNCVFDSTGACSTGNRCVTTNACPALSASSSSITSSISSTTSSSATTISTTSTTSSCPAATASACVLSSNANGGACSCYEDINTNYVCGNGALCINCLTDSGCQTNGTIYDTCVFDTTGQCTGSGGGNLCIASCSQDKKRGRSVFEGGFRLH